MELSDAILKGSQVRPQGVESFFALMPHIPLKAISKYTMKTRPIVSCALGSALEGLWGELEFQRVYGSDGLAPLNAPVSYSHFTDALKEEFPVLTLQMRWLGLTPVNGHRFFTIEAIIFALNDRMGWTREQIAAWLKYVVEGAPMIPEDE